MNVINAIKITQVSRLEHFKQFSTPLSFFMRNFFIPEPRVKCFDDSEITIFGGSRERIETCYYFVGKTLFSRGQVLRENSISFCPRSRKNLL